MQAAAEAAPVPLPEDAISDLMDWMALRAQLEANADESLTVTKLRGTDIPQPCTAQQPLDARPPDLESAPASVPTVIEVCATSQLQVACGNSWCFLLQRPRLLLPGF